MENIPVGLIGCGGRGRGHVRGSAIAGRCRVGRHLRSRCGKPRTGGRRVGIERRYADAEAMLDAEELAAVIVATPAHLNAEAALPCLERGIDTLLEKRRA